MISKKEIIVEKYFGGIFSSTSTLLTDNNKWLIINEILTFINKDKATPVLLPGAPFAAISIPGDNLFFCEIRKNGFSYSDSSDIPFGKFCEDVKKIGEVYKKVLKDIFFNKIGIVVYFVIKSDKPVEYLENFLKININSKILVSDFHINFKEVNAGIVYNFNINLAADNQNKIIRGAFDINNNDPLKGVETMSLEQIKPIYEYAYQYFNDDTKFINFLNNKR